MAAHLELFGRGIPVLGRESGSRLCCRAWALLYGVAASCFIRLWSLKSSTLTTCA